jgi:hypothetical protein
MTKRQTNREFGLGTRVFVNEKAPGGYGARLGTVLEIVLGSRYGVTFDNQKQLIVYLDSECLDPAPKAHKEIVTHLHPAYSAVPKTLLGTRKR